MASISLDEALERAVKHVSQGWLPPQEEVLQKIRSKLTQGLYQNKVEELHQDLKEDFALYTYCLRELSDRLNQVPSAATRMPNEVFEASSLDDFREILKKSSKEISPHSLGEMNEFQANRFRECMLSAATAEVLSEKVEVNPETGFSCGLLRQLGLTLIAWNYPRVYARAIQTLQSSSSLDLNLKKVLGFSPTLLGLSFARRWNLSEPILAAMGERKGGRSLSASEITPEKARENLGATLAKICEVGEALARANHPEQYPDALDDWEVAQSAISTYLGPEGMGKIYQRAEAHLALYAKHLPELQSFADSDRLSEYIIDSQHSTRLLENNQLVRGLPEELRNDFKKLYSRFKPNKILKSNIEFLMKGLIPKSGFNKGAVFMYDPEQRQLTPAIRLGDVAKERLRAVPVNTHLSQFDLIASAFSLKTPLREERVDSDGERTTVMAAALGSVTPVGVLYLEAVNVSEEVDPLVLFRALRQALCDCLNVS